MIIGITQNQMGSQTISFGININNTGWVYYDVGVSLEWEGTTRYVDVGFLDVLQIIGVNPYFDNYPSFPFTLEVNAIGAKGFHGINPPGATSETGLIPSTSGYFTATTDPVGYGNIVLYFGDLGAYVGSEMGSDLQSIRYVY